MRLRYTAILLATLLAATACSRGDSPGTSALDPDYRPPPPVGEMDSRDDNRSTFALDIDTASYTYTARQLNDGRWPDRNAVRPEEFVNYFDQSYRPPSGDGFAVNIDGSRLPASHDDADNVRLLRVGLQTRPEDGEERKVAALTFVVDVSGSMREPGRLDLVVDALHTLVDELRPDDSVAIVAFNNRATVLREMTRVSDGDRLHAAIDKLAVGGGTNLGEGLLTGYEVARDGFRRNATNRVILLSDGLANTGTTDPDRMLRRVRDEADKEIALLGVGVGSHYNDSLMERLADRGDGFVVYVSERRQAREIFVRKLPATLTLRALDAKAQVVFDSTSVESYRLIGYDNRQLADEDFRDDTVDGGEVGPGHSVTALYLVRLRPGAEGRVAQVKVRWLDPESKEPSETYESVAVQDLSGAFDRADPWLHVTYAAALFAEALRDAEDGRRVRLGELVTIAERASDKLTDRKVDELVDLIDRADELR